MIQNILLFVSGLFILVSIVMYLVFIYLPLRNEEYLKKEEEKRYQDINNTIEAALRGDSSHNTSTHTG